MAIPRLLNPYEHTMAKKDPKPPKKPPVVSDFYHEATTFREGHPKRRSDFVILVAPRIEDSYFAAYGLVRSPLWPDVFCDFFLMPSKFGKAEKPYVLQYKNIPLHLLKPHLIMRRRRCRHNLNVAGGGSLSYMHSKLLFPSYPLTKCPLHSKVTCIDKTTRNFFVCLNTSAFFTDLLRNDPFLSARFTPFKGTDDLVDLFSDIVHSGNISAVLLQDIMDNIVPGFKPYVAQAKNMAWDVAHVEPCTVRSSQLHIKNKPYPHLQKKIAEQMVEDILQSGYDLYPLHLG